MAKPQTAVLFVCLGNICRSPLAEGVFRAVVVERRLGDRFVIDSAGTGAWHVGSAPDPRSIAVAARYGVAIEEQQARKVQAEDFDRFDLIFGMDRSNVEDLRRLGGARSAKVQLFMEYALASRRDVPDPYYGGAGGFEAVYRMIREASETLVDRLAGRGSLAPSGQASSTI